MVDAKFGVWLKKAYHILQSAQVQQSQSIPCQSSLEAYTLSLKRKRACENGTKEQGSPLRRHLSDNSILQEMREFEDVANSDQSDKVDGQVNRSNNYNGKLSVNGTTAMLSCPSLSELTNTNAVMERPCPSASVLCHVFEAMSQFSAFKELISVAERVLSVSLASESRESDEPGVPVEDHAICTEISTGVLCNFYIRLSRFMLLCLQDSIDDRLVADNPTAFRPDRKALVESLLQLLKQMDVIDRFCLEAAHRKLQGDQWNGASGLGGPAGVLSLNSILLGLPATQVLEYLASALAGLIIYNEGDDQATTLRKSIWAHCKHGTQIFGECLR